MTGFISVITVFLEMQVQIILAIREFNKLWIILAAQKIATTNNFSNKIYTLATFALTFNFFITSMNLEHYLHYLIQKRVIIYYAVEVLRLYPKVQ